MKNINKIIIIGAGHAGLQAAVSLREKNYTGRILLFDNEKKFPYQKPPLSKKFLLSENKSTSLLRSEEWYKKNKVELFLGHSIKKIDYKNKIIFDKKNNSYSFNKLILATGSKNKSMGTVDLKNAKNVINLRNIDNSLYLRKLLSSSKNLVILGAGFIGLEVASIARSLEKKVTIIEAGNRVMTRSISKDLSDWYIKYHIKMGVNFLFKETIISTNIDNNNITSLITSNNKVINTDCLLVAIGSSPETLIAEESGLKVDNGICVNEKMQTSIDSIYAIGDCTNFLLNSIHTRLESIQNAVDQAKVVANNITGEIQNYDPVPWFWSDQFSLKLQIVGISSKNKNIIKTIGSKEEAQFSNLVFDNNRLTSVETVNKPSHHIQFKNAYKYWKAIKPEMISKDLDLKSFFQKLYQ